MDTQPPGPPEPPVVGSTFDYARDPFRFMDAVRRAYRDIAKFQLGPLDTFILMNPDDVETVLMNDEAAFRKADFQDDALTGLLGDGLLLSTGDYWEQQRSIAQPAFNMGRIASLVETMGEKTTDALDDWPVEEPFDVQLPLARLTVDVIVGAMFGVDPDEETVYAVQDNLEPLGTRFEPDPIRFLTPAWVPTPSNREYNESLATLEGIVEDLIDRRRAGDVDGEDFLSRLLRAEAAGDQTTEQVRNEMMTMLLAGHDTTALTLTYAFHQVGQLPDVLERLHEEVDSVLDEGELPGMSDLRDLSYTERVLKETMRVLPPVYTLFRQSNVDVRLSGYRVPADSLLMVPQWVLHRHPDYWEAPERFDPERWTPERVRERHPYAYFPFGAGPRACIGRQFSLVEAKIIMSLILRRYSPELVSDPDLELRPSLTMHPRDPVDVVFHERD
ncbi:cytochrome P450 [Halomarina oriensis]|uniref:Cytochrome P450 n=1 Tax=Halomarina oriensis TaxID=671145 RepID=A0A6B0GP58_9EURY|nr:cytochrome P450 [Halomarina oriensis]MWG35761.1 cytochrome P450 [Halomarina oriensis]